MPTIPRFILMLIPAESTDHCLDAAHNVYASEATSALLAQLARDHHMPRPALIHHVVTQAISGAPLADDDDELT